MTTKKKQSINHWLQTFGRPPGHKVLKEIKNYASYTDGTEAAEVCKGRQQMLEFILGRLKAASGKKETYASIIYEVELL